MSKFPSVPAYSMSKRPKANLGPDHPGPGAYNWDGGASLVSHKSPTVKLGRAARDGLRPSEVPGPGSYDASNIFNKAKGGYMAHRKQGNYSTDTPGPGAYAQDGMKFKGKVSSGYSFGKGSMANNLGGRSDSPGPGAYNYAEYYGALNKSSGNVLGKAARNALSNSDAPGPGAYDLNTGLLRDKRGAVVGRAPRDGKLGSGAGALGPGGYDVKREFDGSPSKGYKIGKSPRLKLDLDDKPGPGQYDMGRAFEVISHKQGSKLRLPRYCFQQIP